MGTFAEWFGGERLGLLRFATALCADPGTAQEVVQEEAYRASTRWAGIQELQHPDAYLRRRVVNEYLSWRRTWGRLVRPRTWSTGGPSRRRTPGSGRRGRGERS